MSSPPSTEVPFFDAAERALLESRVLRLLERPRTPAELDDLPGNARVHPELRP